LAVPGFKCIQVFVALSVALIAVSTQAAEITTLVADGPNFVSIDGIIQEGDDRTFNGLTAALPAGSVVVHSLKRAGVISFRLSWLVMSDRSRHSPMTKALVSALRNADFEADFRSQLKVV
jgi:hypothetical protein